MAAFILMVDMPATKMTVTEAAVGFFGKIPSRGDFARAGLPRAFTDPWDAWLSHAITGSRELLGERWLPAWMEAPIWHFTLPAGQCGAAPVLGVWMPSIDAAGRHFPLTLAHIGPLPAHPADWLATAEAIGLDALQHDLAPDELVRRLAAPLPLQPDAAENRPPGALGPLGNLALWWTDGSPFVPATRLALTTLPDIATFAAMLHCAAGKQPDFPPGAGGVRE